MTVQPVAVIKATEYLRAHPELHMISGRKLAAKVSEPRCSFTTWDKARKALELPRIPRAGMTYEQHMTPRTAKQERKAAFALYPNTHKIVIDTTRLKIVFHGEGGFKVTEKQTKKALAASLRLFKLAKFETREHNTETGIIVMTLKPEALQAVAA